MNHRMKEAYNKLNGEAGLASCDLEFIDSENELFEKTLPELINRRDALRAKYAEAHDQVNLTDNTIAKLAILTAGSESMLDIQSVNRFIKYHETNTGPNYTF